MNTNLKILELFEKAQITFDEAIELLQALSIKFPSLPVNREQDGIEIKLFTRREKDV
ncbi:MAG: hypothetical protein JSV42_19360 [Chloroflexota bacterium]|nr:MAG: hypothetical protein JSV42_19360 [Chloroflexota bacterium]